jgi:hypothetical protein
VIVDIHPDGLSAASSVPAPCPACGAPLGNHVACQAVFDAFGAASWSAPTRGAVHSLLVDAYCLQHPDDYCRSAKSYAAHLAGLCCELEADGDPRRYWAIPRWLDGSRQITKPTGPRTRGAATIAGVAAGPDDAAYVASVRAWVYAVWCAYSSAQHAFARAWLRVAAGARDTSRGRERVARQRGRPP